MANRGGSVSVSRTHRSSNSSRKPRVPTIVIITAIAIVYRLATTIVTTTSLTIVHKVACQIWYEMNRPDAYPGGNLPEELCAIPEVDKYYTALFSILSVVDGIAGIFGTAASSFLASRFGRKPVFLWLVLLTMVDNLCTVFFQFLHGWKQLAMFALILLVEAIGNGNTTIFLVSMYVVDITEAEERTAALSSIGGWVVLGGALAYTIGGFITTKFHNDVAVYLVSLIMLAAILVFAALFLPESFPADKRELLRLERLAETSSIAERPSWAQRCKRSMAIILEPLEPLKPIINPRTGKQNWRLVWCTIHIMVVTLADSYALPAMMLFFSTKYKYTATQSGYVLTTYSREFVKATRNRRHGVGIGRPVAFPWLSRGFHKLSSLSSVVVLTVILPLLIKIVKPLYSRNKLKIPFVLDEEEDLRASLLETTDDDGEILEADQPVEEVVSETSDHLDVHITIASWTVESLAFIILGTMSTFVGQIIAVASIGLGSGRTPAFRSLVVASVEPLKQGEAMASVEMLGNIGKLLSPIVMGSIMTATISTSPQLIFYVHGAIVAAGAMILFLVRDSDRYQKPAILLDSEELE